VLLITARRFLVVVAPAQVAMAKYQAYGRKAPDWYRIDYHWLASFARPCGAGAAAFSECFQHNDRVESEAFALFTLRIVFLARRDARRD
jgi:hypothetical protein